MNERSCLLIVRKLLDELNQNIVYCHWKSNQHFENALTGIDDLDIIYDRKQRSQMEQILATLNFKHFYTPTGRTYVGVEDFLGFDEETGKMIHLHLYSHLVVGEKHLKGFLLPIEHTILSNRIWNENDHVWFSNPFDELLLLILRVAMKNRKRDLLKGTTAEKSAKYEYLWLKERCPNFNEMLKKQAWLSERIKKEIAVSYQYGFRWTNCSKLKWLLYRELLCYSQGGFFHNTFSRHIRESNRVVLEIQNRYLHTKYRLLRRRNAVGGITIALLGSDGAGKSSSIQRIYHWLVQVMDVRYFYLGSGDGRSSILRKPLKLAKRLAQRVGIIKKTNNFTDSSLKRTENTHLKLNCFYKLWIYLLSKERKKKLIQVNHCRQCGFVVLTDRYPQLEFDGLCDGMKLRGQSGIAAKAEKEAYRVAQLCPPDLAIKLIVSPEEAIKRKPGEIDYETSQNLTKRIQQLCFSERTVCVEINANQSPEQVLLEIKRAIWKSL